MKPRLPVEVTGRPSQQSQLQCLSKIPRKKVETYKNIPQGHNYFQENSLAHVILVIPRSTIPQWQLLSELALFVLGT